MADLPLEGRTAVETKVTPFTTEEQLKHVQDDIRELARGVNTQGALLEAIVLAFDQVVKKYLDLTRRPATVVEPNVDKPVA